MRRLKLLILHYKRGVTVNGFRGDAIGQGQHPRSAREAVALALASIARQEQRAR